MRRDQLREMRFQNLGLTPRGLDVGMDDDFDVVDAHRVLFT
jgi:hypothetical protein